MGTDDVYDYMTMMMMTMMMTMMTMMMTMMMTIVMTMMMMMTMMLFDDDICWLYMIMIYDDVLYHDGIC